MSLHGRNVLVVEDDPAAWRAPEDLLVRAGAVVVQTPDYRACEILATRHRPDAVVLDPDGPRHVLLDSAGDGPIFLDRYTDRNTMCDSHTDRHAVTDSERHKYSEFQRHSLSNAYGNGFTVSDCHSVAHAITDRYALGNAIFNSRCQAKAIAKLHAPC